MIDIRIESPILGLHQYLTCILYTEIYVCIHCLELYYRRTFNTCIVYCILSSVYVYPLTRTPLLMYNQYLRCNFCTHSCVCMYWYSKNIFQSLTVRFILQRIFMLEYICVYPLFEYMSYIRGRQFTYASFLFRTYYVGLRQGVFDLPFFVMDVLSAITFRT